MNKTLIKKIFEDKAIQDAMALTIFVIIESLQFLILLALVYSFIPLPLADFIKDLPVKLQKTIKPKREMFFYHWFLILAFGLQIAFVSLFRYRKMDIPRQVLLKIAGVDACLILIQLFAVFKIWQYDDPWWARDLLYGGIGAWLLSKIFWSECQQGLKIISEVMMEKRKILKCCVDGLVPVLLIACLWVPDVQKVLGRVFVWDQFRNWDTFLILPGWGYTHGLGLDMGIISSWGMGAVIFISRCSQLLGSFDYAHVLTVLLWMVIIYYGVLYAFLRAWLGSVLLAATTVAVAVKVQMFHTGISPLIWIFPQDTAIRHWLDIPVFWCLWQYARSSQGKYLAYAAVGIGIALAWVFSTGLCLLVAFWGFLIFSLMVPEYRPVLAFNYKDIRRICFYSLTPLAVMILTLFVLQGNGVFQASFWKNMAEPIQLFLHGVGTLSFYACLYDRHFFAFVAGFVIPVIYVWTLIVIAGLAYAKKLPREELFLIPLSLYGLGMYTHYLAHSSISHYYAVGIPVVMVIGFWISKMMAWFSSPMRLKVLLLLAVGAWGALFTNIFFVYYPNVFDVSRMDWKPEIGFYQSQFKFDQDAAMIARLTPEHQAAPVISSFEAQLLMQANRRPFFYDAPLIISERMDINDLAGTSLITPERLNRTVNQITQKSPEYIFVDKRLLSQWTQQQAQRFPGAFLTLQYVSQHYVPQEEGLYLIAMHKK